MEAELEALEQEQLDNDLLGVGTSAAELPEVPSGDVKEPAVASKEKEKKKGKDHLTNISLKFQNQGKNPLYFFKNLKLIWIYFSLFSSSQASWRRWRYEIANVLG